jgi:hypothetical protein
MKFILVITVFKVNIENLALNQIPATREHLCGSGGNLSFKILLFFAATYLVVNECNLFSFIYV